MYHKGWERKTAIGERLYRELLEVFYPGGFTNREGTHARGHAVQFASADIWGKLRGFYGGVRFLVGYLAMGTLEVLLGVPVGSRVHNAID